MELKYIIGVNLVIFIFIIFVVVVVVNKSEIGASKIESPSPGEIERVFSDEEIEMMADKIIDRRSKANDDYDDDYGVVRYYENRDGVACWNNGEKADSYDNYILIPNTDEEIGE